MTRDFNKPKRESSNSSFRNSSPNRNRDEHPSRPARPRLNRETVDRAWESGAQQQHADYRPRTGGGQARPQGQRNGNWNSSPNTQGYSSQNGRNGSRPYNNNRQENFRDNRSEDYRENRNRRDTPRNFDRPSGNTSDYRPARPPYEQERRGFGGQRPDNRRNSFDNSNRRGSADRTSYQDRGNSRQSFNDADRPRWQNRPDEQRNNTRGQERNFNSGYRNGNERFEGDYEQFDRRDTRPSRLGEKRYEDHPSRPQRPNDRPFADRDTRNTYPPRDATRRFEDRDTRNTRPPRDDTRRFEDRDTRPSRPTERPFSGSRSVQNKPGRRFDEQKSEPEKHVTRLPDGRVLKGPRPVQRRNAEFWKDITADMNELVGHVQVPDEQTQAEPLSEVQHDTQAQAEILNKVQHEEQTQADPLSEVQHENSVVELASAESTPVTDVQMEVPPAVESEVPQLAADQSTPVTNVQTEVSSTIASEVPPPASVESASVTGEQSENVALESPSTAEGTSEATPAKRRVRTVRKAASESLATENAVSEVPPAKRRVRTASSAVARTKKPRSTGPKPSQRGFKWTNQE